MTRAIQISFLIISTLFLFACSSHLKSIAKPDDDIIAARADYDSDRNEAIEAQEIHKGMSPADVYFSWGRPEHRFRTSERERWIYMFEGDGDQPDRVVWLHFENGKLKRWTVDRGFMEFVNPSTIDEGFGTGRPTSQETGK
ncbi:outer membrane protein assembly factor BamE [bacterium]|nr:outer membrane protein assembly factor BamE [bacterium]